MSKLLKKDLLREDSSYQISQVSAGIAAGRPIGFIAMFSGAWTDNVTIPGWYKCDGNNGTINLVDKFVRGGATSGATGGSDDAVVVSHSHTEQIHGVGGGGSWAAQGINTTTSVFNTAFKTALEGVSGVNANIPAHYTLIFIQRIS